MKDILFRFTLSAENIQFPADQAQCYIGYPEAPSLKAHEKQHLPDQQTSQYRLPASVLFFPHSFQQNHPGIRACACQAQYAERSPIPGKYSQRSTQQEQILKVFRHKPDQKNSDRTQKCRSG